MYKDFPVFEKHIQSNLTFLLPWCWSVGGHPCKAVSHWVRSESGDSLYDTLLAEISADRCVERLIQAITALSIYWILASPGTELEAENVSEQPIYGCFLADLDALLNGQSLENKAQVGERMICSMKRILTCEQRLLPEKLLVYDPPLDRLLALHPLDGLSDQYWRLRFEHCTHTEAYSKLSTKFEMGDFRKDIELDWIIVK